MMSGGGVPSLNPLHAEEIGVGHRHKGSMHILPQPPSVRIGRAAAVQKVETCRASRSLLSPAAATTALA